MSAVATRDVAAGQAAEVEHAHVEEPRTDGSAQKLFESRGETLEDVILGAWEDLVAGRRAECPVCGGSMSLIDCKSCGSELS